MKLKVIEEETGREVTVTMPANEALDEIDARKKLLTQLLDCLRS